MQQTIKSEVDVLVTKLPGETFEQASQRQDRLSEVLWARMCRGPRAVDVVDAAYALGPLGMWIGRN